MKKLADYELERKKIVVVHILFIKETNEKLNDLPKGIFFF